MSTNMSIIHLRNRSKLLVPERKPFAKQGVQTHSHLSPTAALNSGSYYKWLYSFSNPGERMKENCATHLMRCVCKRDGQQFVFNNLVIWQETLRGKRERKRLGVSALFSNNPQERGDKDQENSLSKCFISSNNHRLRAFTEPLGNMNREGLQIWI